MPTPSAPEVSICVPTYNGDAFLSQCLNSVLAQTTQNWELIIVDDSSTDSTLEIARRLADREPRIRIERNVKRLGLVNNWNRCVELSRGNWIKFVFQDDLIAPTCVAELLEAGLSGCSLVFCERHLLFDESTDARTRAHYETIASLTQLFGSQPFIKPDSLARAILTEPYNFFGEPTAALLHRSVFDRFGYFNPHFVQLCDWEYWIRVGVNTGIALVPRKLASFRFHRSSTSAANRSRADFRSGQLDRLLLLHEFAENPHFAPLRNAAASQVPPRRFRMELARKALWLKGIAERAAADPVAPDPRPLEAWRTVSAHFPKLEQSMHQVPLKLREMLDRHLLWRFRKGRG